MEEIIGYAAGILTLVTMIPQIIKSLKTKKVEDVSYLMVVVFALSMLLWVLYAVLIESWPIIITNTIAFVITCVQFTLMVKYKKSK